MTPLSMAVAGVAILAAVLFALWTYRRREVRVPGANLLISLRAAALAVVVLLLLNPRIPGGDPPGASSGDWLLLDASLSMAAARGQDPSAWDEARDDIGDPAGTTVLFGAGARAVDDLEGRTPQDVTSRLAAAVRLAAEGGAPSIRVVSDFRVTDLPEALSLIDAAGVTAELTPIESEVVNAGVAEFQIPDYIGPGDTASVEVSVFATGLPASDSILITVWDEDRQVGSAVADAPRPGALRRVDVRLPPPAGEAGLHRYRARAQIDSDAFPDDDERVAYVRTDRRRGGIVLVSRAADWEPRFLLPTLAEVTGLEPEGFLDLSGGRFLPTANEDGTGTGIPVDSAAVRRRAASAELLVIHGASDVDPWLESTVGAATRLLLLPRAPEGLAPIPLTVGRPIPGEWYLDETLPASPVTAGLTGLDPQGLPPLGPVMPIAGTPGWSAALTAGRSSGGPREAVIAVDASGGRRRAVVLAGGLWRWAFRGGAELAAYRRVWSAVGGWLVGGRVAVATADVEPEPRVVPRGQTVVWRAAGYEGQALRFRVIADGAEVQDTVITVSLDGIARSSALPPSEYRYEVSDPDAGEARGSGRFDVERFVPELRWPIADPDVAVRTAGVSGSTRVGGRRLRTSVLPYLLLIGILSLEWYLRRERGLR